MQYAAIEFIPMTTNGNAHRFIPFTSISELNPAVSRKHQPPLNNTQLGVQMRFTTGQTPKSPINQPLIRPIRPATTNHFTLPRGSRLLRNTLPAINPRIIVPSVGMKLSVEYPPHLNENGFSRGKRFRNHTSNRHARFVFLFQCAANPLIQCGQSLGTPTVVVSKSGGGRW